MVSRYIFPKQNTTKQLLFNVVQMGEDVINMVVFKNFCDGVPEWFQIGIFHGSNQLLEKGFLDSGAILEHFHVIFVLE